MTCDNKLMMIESHARQLLYVSQEIIKLKLRLEEELVRFDAQFSSTSSMVRWNVRLIELMRRINYEIDSEKDYSTSKNDRSKRSRNFLVFVLDASLVEIDFLSCWYSSCWRSSQRISNVSFWWSIIIEYRWTFPIVARLALEQLTDK